MEDSVKERLKQFLKQSNIKGVDFCQSINVSIGFISGMRESIQPDKLKSIAIKYPRLSIEWLLIGEGSMLKPEQISSIVERLKHFIEKQGITEMEFCEAIDMPYVFYTEMKGAIPEKHLKNIIAKYPDLSIAWLIAGEGSMLKSENNSSTIASTKEEGIKITKPRIPYAASAGSLTSAVDGITEAECEQIPVITAFPSYDFTMFVKGDSMYPNYEGGDEIACKRIDSTSFIQWGKVHVLDTAQGIVIKRVYDADGNIRCSSYNKEYPDFTISKEEVYSMSLVVGMLRL